MPGPSQGWILAGGLNPDNVSEAGPPSLSSALPPSLFIAGLPSTHYLISFTAANSTDKCSSDLIDKTACTCRLYCK